MKKKLIQIPKYLVIFDTNILLHHFPAVEHLITKYISDERVDIKFLIPDLVSLEYQHNYLVRITEAAQKYNGGGKDLNNLIGVRHKKFEISKEKAYKKAARKLKILGINEFPIKYKKINLEKIAKMAAFHDSPFQPVGDKGFKDALIAEGIIDLLNENSKYDILVFICKDEMLRTHALDLTKSYSHLKVYESPPDFETELNLHLLQINDKLIDEIRKEADKEFSNIYRTENIEARIHESYSSLFSNPKPLLINNPWTATFSNNQYIPSDIKWIPIEEPVYEITKPVFKYKNDNIYFWETTVVYKQKFEEEFRIGASVGYAGYIRQGIYTLEFTVKWSTNLDEHAKIFNSSILSIRHDVPLPEEYYWAATITPYVSGASLAGQGTAPIK